MDSAGPQLIASDATRQALGWIGPRTAEVAGVDTLVVTRGDITVLNSFVQVPDLLDLSRDPESMVDWDKTNENLRDTFNRAGIPPDYFTAPQIEGFARSIVLQQASAFPMDFEGDGTNDFGLITAPDLDADPRQYVSNLTGIPAERLMNVPGDSEDYVALIMFHEAGHVAQPAAAVHNRTADLPFEIDADQKSFQAYLQSAAEGRDLDPAVLHMIRDARIVGSVQDPGSHLGLVGNMLGMHTLGSAPSHTTGFFLDADNGLPQVNAEAALAATHGMLMTNMVVNMAVGLHAMTEIAQQVQGIDPGLPPEEYAGRMEEVLGQYGMTQTDFVQALTGNTLKTVQLGAAYGAANPGASFAALEALHEKGYLRNQPGTEPYIEKVRSFHAAHTQGIEQEPAYLEVRALIDRMPHIDDFGAAETPAPETRPEGEGPGVLPPPASPFRPS